jgi:flagellar biosynthetic protein FliQ
MDSDFAMRLLADTLLASVKVAAPFLIATLVIGLIVSILQVVTQIQEMTLTFIPKLIVVGLVCMLLGAWMLSVMVEFAQRLFETAGSI